MKIKLKLLCVLLTMTLLSSACGIVGVRKPASNTKTVSDVLNEKIKADQSAVGDQANLDDKGRNDLDQVATDSGITPSVSEESAPVVRESDDLAEEEGLTSDAGPEEDVLSRYSYLEQDAIDLTVLNKDMVYTIVYQMMLSSESFLDKEITMSGPFSIYYDENTDKTYFAVLIQDALACCSSGIEFIWDDGSHVYPDEYPEVGTEITVSGIFETYEEAAYPGEYLRLRHATMEVND